jgi:hypothetical protein
MLFMNFNNTLTDVWNPNFGRQLACHIVACTEDHAPFLLETDGSVIFKKMWLSHIIINLTTLKQYKAAAIG